MNHPLFLLIGGLGTTEILLIVFAIVLLFGAKRIPELFKGMGQGVREFKDATKDAQAPQFRDQSATPPAQAPYQQHQQPGQAPQGQPSADFYPSQGQQPSSQAPNFYPNNDPTQPRQ
jgi:TatA/E family protein of Tat protein translocase